MTNNENIKVTESRRVNVNFSDNAWATLQNLAEKKGCSVSQVLRDALALEKWYADLTRDGGKLILEGADGKRREIVAR